MTRRFLQDRQRLRDALATIDPGGTDMPAERLEDVRVLIDAGELEVGLEILSDNIYEFMVPVPEGTRSVLIEIGRSIGLGKHYLDLLSNPN